MNLSFFPSHCLELFTQKKHDDLSRYLLSVLDDSTRVSFHEMDDDRRLLLDIFIQNLLFYFCQPDYVVSKDVAFRFVQHNQTISNLTALSSFRTTDAALRIVASQENNLFKLLALYSPRNTLRLNRKLLFDTSPEWASLWWFTFVGDEWGRVADKEALARLREHFADMDPRLHGAHTSMLDSYFSVTYIALEHERQVKQRINALIRREWAAGIRVNNRPRRESIAVMSTFWTPGHSVYRNAYRFVEALAERYEITFVNLSFSPGAPIDTRFFRRVVHIDQSGGNPIGELADNDFAAVYYTDIGMSLESIFLANLRLAPVQLASAGHPVSTFGAEIDYFVTGRDSEILEDAEKNYSERLVLTPGIGFAAHPIQHKRRFPDKPESPFLINCPWGAQKTNHDHLRLLRRIRDAAHRPVMFQFFPGPALRNAGWLPFAQALREAVGEDSVRIHLTLPQPVYFEEIEKGHLTLDAYPFGGINTLADSLHVGVPFMTYEGKRIFNRFASTFWRQQGIDALVAVSDDEYVAKVVRLIDDDSYRAEVVGRVLAIDLDKFVHSVDPSPAFRKAIDYILDHHQELSVSGDRSPLLFD